MSNLNSNYKSLLIVASKLHSIGSTLNFYKSNDNAFDFILNGLNYDFSHNSRIVVAHTIKFSKKFFNKFNINSFDFFDSIFTSIFDQTTSSCFFSFILNEIIIIITACLLMIIACVR